MSRKLALAFGLSAILSATAGGHAGLRMSSPLDGVSLGETPAAVLLTFTERPEPSLSEIHVSDSAGTRYETGRPAAAAGDPLSLSVAVRPLGTGVYTVTWRTVSAVDGHAGAGAYAFGVRASPAGVVLSSTAARASPLEIGARWMLAAGLVLALGAAAGCLLRFGGPDDAAIARAGWLTSVVGVLLLAWAQKRSGSTTAAAFLATSIGRALVWRAAAIGIAGAALGVAYSARRRSEPRVQSGAMIVFAIAVLAVMAIHAAAGHAAAHPEAPATEVLVQWIHFASCGIWIGGLVSLLSGVRTAASDVRRTAAHRFSSLAAAGIAVVLLTGLLRAFHELTSWTDLATTGYGRTLLVKTGLFAVVAALGAANRWRAVPLAAANADVLRRIGRAEVACAAAALGAAALLGAVAPPGSARPLPGISVDGADFGTTVRARFTAVSDQPGPNRFVVRIADYDSQRALRGDRVGLRFASLDDPDLPATSLPLRQDADGSYAGSGANLSLDGRWRVTVVIERERTSVDVPMDIVVRGRPRTVVVTRLANGRIRYGVEIRNVGILNFEIERLPTGRTRLYVDVLDFILDERQVSRIVVTLGNRDHGEEELRLERLSGGRFAADVNLAAGINTVAAFARTLDGARLRAVVQVDTRR